MMKSKYSQFIWILAMSLLFASCERPKGFTLKKILSHHENDARWEVSPSSSYEQAELNEMFGEPFTYLGSGNHCYAFASENGKFVLKFFKQRHMRSQSNEHKRERERAFTSYKIAYEHLKKETGLFYLHLNKTNHLSQTVTLIDQHGNPLVIDLDKMEFLVQKRAELSYEHLRHLFSNGKREAALESITSLLSIVSRRIEKGYADADMQFFKNFGFVGNQAIEIDLDKLRLSPVCQDVDDTRTELTRVSSQLIHWMENHYPEYQSDVEMVINDMINQVRE